MPKGQKQPETEETDEETETEETETEEDLRLLTDNVHHAGVEYLKGTPFAELPADVLAEVEANPLLLAG